MQRQKIKGGLTRLKARLAEYNKILRIDAIARRYLAMNAFDGVLTIFGILIGSYFAGIAEQRIIIVAGIGAALAIAVSGFWGAYLTEVAERKRELRELERAMLTGLRRTKIGMAARIAPWIVAIVDAAAPFAAALVLIIPFGILPIHAAYLAAFGLAGLLLFSLGLWLGSLSKENVILSGLKMLAAGGVAATLCLGLQAAGII